MINRRRVNLIATTAATAAFAAVVGLGTLVIGAVAARAQFSEHAEGVKFASAVINDVNGVLNTLVGKMTPECTPGALRQLREVTFASSYASDIAVLNAKNEVVCSTTLGVPDYTLPGFKPEYEFQQGNKKVAVSRYAARFYGGKGEVVKAVRTGPFQVTISPNAVERMAASRYSVFGLVRDNGTFLPLRTSTIDGHGPEPTKAFLSDPSEWQRDGKGFNFKTMAYEAHDRIAPTPYVFYTAAPLINGDVMEPEYVILLLVLGAIIGGLVFNASRTWRISRYSMDRRIVKLLKQENIRTLYQPIVKLDSGHIIGCEVLVRLQDGNKLRTPDQFLPSVIKNNLTWTLDEAVMRVSLGELTRAIPPWKAFKIAINLFPENIIASRLHTLLHDDLRFDTSAAVKINFEVIEQDYRDSIIHEISTLKGMAYQISVDDFGTGYSNLGSIRKMRPHFLKIDRSFVHEMEEATVRSSLIPEIVAIGRATGAAIVAEGIENELQRKALIDMNVDFGQGYLFGKPMPLAAFLDALNTQEAAVQSDIYAADELIEAVESNGFESPAMESLQP